MAKKNAKAKRAPVPEFDTLCVPPPCKRLTPKRAREWMRASFPAYQWIVGRNVTAGHGTREFLASGLEEMVGACMTAIETDRPVRLTSSVWPKKCGKGVMPGWNEVEAPLAIVHMAMGYRYDNEMEIEHVRPVLLELVETALRTAQAGQAEEMRSWRAGLDERQREREEDCCSPRVADVYSRLSEWQQQKAEVDETVKELEQERDELEREFEVGEKPKESSTSRGAA